MNRRIGHEEIRRDLERLGVTAGDVLLVHSSLRAIGDVDGGAATLVAALSEALGSSGTLVVPTFTPSIRDPHRTCQPRREMLEWRTRGTRSRSSTPRRPRARWARSPSPSWIFLIAAVPPILRCPSPRSDPWRDGCARARSPSGRPSGASPRWYAWRRRTGASSSSGSATTGARCSITPRPSCIRPS